MAAGIAIMLLSFGPGVFYLFVERCRRLQFTETSTRPRSDPEVE
jgi:hypothetical protein